MSRVQIRNPRIQRFILPGSGYSSYFNTLADKGIRTGLFSSRDMGKFDRIVASSGVADYFYQRLAEESGVIANEYPFVMDVGGGSGSLGVMINQLRGGRPFDYLIVDYYDGLKSVAPNFADFICGDRSDLWVREGKLDFAFYVFPELGMEYTIYKDLEKEGSFDKGFIEKLKLLGFLNSLFLPVAASFISLKKDGKLIYARPCLGPEETSETVFPIDFVGIERQKYMRRFAIPISTGYQQRLVQHKPEERFDTVVVYVVTKTEGTGSRVRKEYERKILERNQIERECKRFFDTVFADYQI